MFEHSLPVPRLYKLAAKIIEAASKNEDSVNNLVYEANHTNTKALYALVVETLRYSKQLDFLLEQSKLFEKEPRFNPWLAKVLITELLWGKKYLPGQSKPIKTILTYQQILSANARDLHKTNSAVNKVNKPRFVRINTILTTINDAIDAFRDEGWTLVRHMDTKDYNGFLEKIRNLTANQFMVDFHVPELLIFPPNTEFHTHDSYKSGRVILQDKASCLPAHLLSPEPGSIVLDMCAAPGMKTSHLAAKLNNNGKIYAVDVDTKRLKTLEELMHKTGITCVQTINKDIIKVTNDDCKDVEYILVDPSCSGSGIVNRLDLTEPNVKNDERIQKLKGFQIMILKHALRRFPKAKKVIYSTCSLYPEENEEVIKEVVHQTAYYKLLNVADLLKRPWLNFGSEKYGDIGKFCLYCKPDKEMSNGFFVAVFQRLENGQENQFYVPNRKFENSQNSNDITGNKEETNYINSSGPEKMFAKQNIQNKDKNETRINKVVLRKSKKKKKKCKRKGTNISSDNVQSMDTLEDHLNEKKRKNVNVIQSNCEDNINEIKASTNETKKKERNISKCEKECMSEQALAQCENHDVEENDNKTKKHRHNLEDNEAGDEVKNEVCNIEITEMQSKKKRRKCEEENIEILGDTQSVQENKAKKTKHKRNCDSNETDRDFNFCGHAIITDNYNLVSSNTDDNREKTNSVTYNSESDIEKTPSKKKKKRQEKADSNNLEETESIGNNSKLILKKKHMKERPDAACNESTDYNMDLFKPHHMSVEDLLENYIKDKHEGSNTNYDSYNNVSNLGETQSPEGNEAKKKKKHKRNCDSNETEGDLSSNSHTIVTDNYNLASNNSDDNQEKTNTATCSSETSPKKKKKTKEKRDSDGLEGTESVQCNSGLILKKRHKKERPDEAYNEKTGYNMDLFESQHMSVEDLLENYIKEKHSKSRTSYDSYKNVSNVGETQYPEENEAKKKKKHKRNCDSNETNGHLNSSSPTIVTDNYNLASNNSDDNQEKTNTATCNFKIEIKEMLSKKKKTRKEKEELNNSGGTERKEERFDEKCNERRDYNIDLIESQLMSVEDLLEKYIKEKHGRSSTSYDSCKNVTDKDIHRNENVKGAKNGKHSLDANKVDYKKKTKYTQNICGFLE